MSNNNRINIMYGSYDFDFVDEFNPLIEECGVVYTDAIIVEDKTTQVCSFFTETNDDITSLSVPDCKCLEH